MKKIIENYPDKLITSKSIPKKKQTTLTKTLFHPF